MRKIDSLAEKSDVPTKVSQLTNDSGFITSAPVTSVNGKTGAVTLSASDVGADVSGTASSAVSTHNTNTSAHADIREQISQLSSEKVDKTSLTLGVHTDGLLYLFIDGTPIGTGVEMYNGADVFGYVDSANNIVVQGKLADGTYSVKYEMDDGSTVAIGNLVLDSNVYYTITKNLINCTISNNATEVISGQSYSATITANSGYELKSVSVTMGGANVSVTNGAINIASVTGNIVITAVAEVAGPAYVNQIPLSIGTDGKPFNNGQGYKTGYRLSLSGGGESAQEGTEVTGFIPVTRTSVLRIKNIAYEGDLTRGIVGYDANFNPISIAEGQTPGANLNSIFGTGGYDDGNGVRRSSTLAGHVKFDTDTIKYIRLCSTDINANSIITVDQEIV